MKRKKSLMSSTLGVTSVRHFGPQPVRFRHLVSAVDFDVNPASPTSESRQTPNQRNATLSVAVQCRRALCIGYSNRKRWSVVGMLRLSINNKDHS